MGFYFHLHVCFSADSNDGVAALAVKHLDMLKRAEAESDLRGEPIDCREAIRFLRDLSERTGPNLGTEGGLSLWGIVGSCIDAADFVAVLRPFWAELLAGDVHGGPCTHEHVIVFHEREERGKAGAFEISRDDRTAELVVMHHEDLPFCWYQM